jgi:hypothetical protein
MSMMPCRGAGCFSALSGTGFSLVSLLLNAATMSQESSLTQSARSVRQVLTAYTHNRPLKTRLVTKLRGTRERIRETQGKCEGRKSYAERHPELVVAAKRLHRRSRKGYRRSRREIARELQAMGYSNKQGTPYSASCVKSMIEGPSP